MMRQILFPVMAVLAICAVAGCHKSDGTVHLKQVNDALVAAGYRLDSFHPVDGARYSAKSCASGTLAGLDALVCEYPTPSAQALGKPASEQWIGGALTGVVLQNGLTTLALADRAHADPNGRNIQKLSQTYQQVK